MSFGQTAFDQTTRNPKVPGNGATGAKKKVFEFQISDEKFWSNFDKKNWRHHSLDGGTSQTGGGEEVAGEC